MTSPPRSTVARLARSLALAITTATALLAACDGKVEVQRTPGPSLTYVADAEWSALPGGRTLGQVAGLALDADGAVWVFHRAGAGFDNEAIIDEPTIAVFDPASGEVLRELGAGLFVTPHGLAIDDRGHVWTTDTGRNLVFELAASGEVLHVYDGR